MSVRTVDLDINVEYVTRVEGHGNIVVNVKEGKIEKCELDIVEPPRFFESFLRGRTWEEAALITSRICGICSPGHQITSLKATEDALKIDISEQTRLLRKLLIDASFLQSHVLHVYFLTAPDLLKVPSVIPLVETHPEVVRRALRLKKLANDICDIVGGRAVHPIRLIPGGFSKVPAYGELLGCRRQIREAIPDVLATVKTIESLIAQIPSFERETEYVSLKKKGEYTLYDGQIYSSDTGCTQDKNYLNMTNEKVIPHSTAKHTSINRPSYMVGALARCNNNADEFNETASKAAKVLGYIQPSFNPYMNNICQVIEAGLVMERMIETIDRLLEKGLREEPKQKVRLKASRGIGCTEVPRGILYHDYTFNDQGVVTEANCIIPTGQNLANIEEDMKKLVPEFMSLGKSQEEITFALEMLVRAYDPCISCSVHLLDVKYV